MWTPASLKFMVDALWDTGREGREGWEYSSLERAKKLMKIYQVGRWSSRNVVLRRFTRMRGEYFSVRKLTSLEEGRCMWERNTLI